MEHWQDRQKIESIGRCIYCPATEGLTDEHILAKALGGKFIFKEASCESCREITRKIEESCCRRGIFFLYRLAHDVQSDHKHEWPKHWPLIVTFKDHEEKRPIPVEDYPIVQLDFPLLPPPGITIGAPPTDQLVALPYEHRKLTHKRYAEIIKPFQDEGAISITPFVEYNLNQFMRLLAKTAHGIAIAHFGYEKFKPYLPPYILGDDTRLFYVIGTIGEKSEIFSEMEIGEAKPMSHAFEAGILKINEKSYATVRIQLFKNLGAPVYEIIAGEMT